ncbi:MAG: arylsulfatase, partial [Planctomycetaceae bacterium]
MRSRLLIPSLLLVIGAMLGWLVASGPVAVLLGDEPPARAAATDGRQLPQPDPVFKGKVGETYKDSTPDYPRTVRAPQGAPNVLLVLLDDVGFGM